MLVAMKRIAILVALLSAAGIALAGTEWLEFNAGCPEGSEPLVQYNNDWDDFLTFDVELRGLLADTVEVDSIKYLRFRDTPGIAVSNMTGYPELPIVRCFVWVPDSTDLSVQYAVNCLETTPTLPVYPCPKDSVPSDDPGGFSQEYFRKDSTAYSMSEWYPDTLAQLTGVFYLRDTRIAIVDVWPVQYLPDEDSLRVWSDIEIMLEFEDTTATWSTRDLGPYEDLIRGRLLGYDPDDNPWAPVPGIVERPRNLTQGPTRVSDYVILVAAGLDCALVDTLGKHRADLCGLDVAIVRTDSVLSQFGLGGGTLTSSIIRDFTEAMWEWGQPSSSKRPSYLLLIGDHEDPDSASRDWFLPTEVELGDGGWEPYANDEWYVCFGEPRSTFSSFPDMIVGRLPARTSDDLTTMIDVIRWYEAESSIPEPDSLAWRRDLARLVGYGFWGGAPLDSIWGSELASWGGFGFENWYCGDGDAGTSSDSSTMSSGDWVHRCTDVLGGGTLITWYVDHGSVHYFDCGMDEELGDYAGRPDSTFDDEDVDTLCSDGGEHGYPLLFFNACGVGTYNWTDSLHYNTSYALWTCYTPDTSSVQYDFDVDCFAEEFLKNRDGGAIGVFANAWSLGWSSTYPETMEEAIKSILYYANSMIGNAIQAGRLARLHRYWTGFEWHLNLASLNLLGDPAVDVGDRVKFRDYCDLIISPEDLDISRYPTRPVGSGTDYAELYCTVRNGGADSSGRFDTELSIHIAQYDTTLEVSGTELAPGEETRLSFRWHVPQTVTPPVTIALSAEADPDEDCDDCWRANNTAGRSVKIDGFYPNDTGWPIRLIGSVLPPPALADLDGDGDLEIVTCAGIGFIQAIEPDSVAPIWTSDNLDLGGWLYGGALTGFYTIPVVGNVCGDTLPEVVVNTMSGLFVLDGNDGSTLCVYDHVDYQDNPWCNYPQTVVLADLVRETGQVARRDEIAFVLRDSLHVLRCQGDSIATLDVEFAPASYTSLGPYMAWVATADIDGTFPLELLLTCTEETTFGDDSSCVHVYNYTSGTIVDSAVWEDELFWAIPAVGELAGNTRIAVSRRLASSDFSPVYILDTSLSLHDTCTVEAGDQAEQVLCCIMADWTTTTTGLDRILAPAENQCFCWDDDGFHQWSPLYSETDTYRPPFPALGNLDNTDDPDVIVATRTGLVSAYDETGTQLLGMGFPYTLPASVCGGFVIADIDNDEKVEVVFGTTDNYLHVWELGSCTEGYAPWPQCQHDAGRTGVLE